ncbi:unnamed protein product [Euphydryas editha]|uniref:Chromatin assembly factor 1 subunit A dimerization domain-containing protein n=1 Tax=Euphydryas editha TaxID=104508 RepID=A0AAU9TL63_EUPED|nr:unnamed protein product [Euphydryas editha]
MKTQKSSDSEDVTPTKKVLKQARLPFMIISDVSPKSVTPQSRKRKLSVPQHEPATKVGKIDQETDLAQELVVISDDDSKEAQQVEKVDKKLNPYVKLVDTAWKKKAQKTKSSKKKKSEPKKSKLDSNISTENDENACESSGNSENKAETVEEMEVDDSQETNIEMDVVNNEYVKTESKEIIKNSVDIKLQDDNIATDKGSNSSEDLMKENDISSNNEKDCSSKDKNEDETSQIDKNTSLNEIIDVTPKRSQKNKTKSEEKNSNTSIISNCDESFSSNTSTPRRSNRVSLTNSQGDVSSTETNSKITPRQLQKKLESAKKKEEREKERIEREKKKQQEKDERARQKQEKEEQRKREREEKEEAKRREKEEKEEQRRKEREEKEKQKELEKKLKEEKEEQKRKEREEKEEQKKKEKEAREEEKRKRQEALEQEKLEQEQKKKKAAEAFVSFFVPKQKGEKEQITLGTISNKDILSSFTVKSDMRLAPTTRVTLNEENRKVLENFIQEQNVPESSLYIKCLKGSHKPLSNGKTWPLSDKDDEDVMIVEDELPPVDGSETIACDIVKREKLRPKLLAFHENRRPPYWGTWRKKSKFINPRRPFKTDEKLLDYEVDSDEEWEEEQEGESIDGSAAGSDDEQDADEYEVDNELFVPHGYLSDEEATVDEDDVMSLSPETQKARLKYLEDEFEFEMKKPMEKLKPRLYGLLWETEDGGRPENCPEALWNYFGKLSMIMNDPTPFLQPSNETEDTDKKKVKKKKTPDGEQKSPKNEKKKKSKADDKEGKKPKVDTKKTTTEIKKNQPGINTFLTTKKNLNI